MQNAFVRIFLRQMHLYKQIVDDLFLRTVEGLAGSVHRQDDVFRDGQIRQQIETLENNADIMTAVPVSILLRQIVAVVQHLSLCGIGKPGNQR